jgi:hypothetical protein
MYASEWPHQRRPVKPQFPYPSGRAFLADGWVHDDLTPKYIRVPSGNQTMIGPPAISKHMPRGQPFQKGQSGNPRGRPKRTPEEVQLIEACRVKTPEALEVTVDLMHNGENGRARGDSGRASRLTGPPKHEQLPTAGSRAEGRLMPSSNQPPHDDHLALPALDRGNVRSALDLLPLCWPR